jgi:molybdate transport system substrate-binding protein
MRYVLRLFLLGAMLVAVPWVDADTINLAAAISLKETMIDANIAYSKATGNEVEFSFGASGLLLTQIRNGAPIDGFISAAVEQVDAMEKANLAVPGSRRDVAVNELVLIVPANSTLKLTGPADLKRDDVKRIAVGQPKVVPAGAYAMQSLKHLKLADALAGKLVNGATVRQVLDYVARGEVDAGFVYATDAEQAGARVHVIAVAPAESHEPIVYPGVIVAASNKQASVKKFLDFLATPAGKKILRRHGFSTPPPATQPSTK